jgi:hypothetical protein
MVTNDLTAYSAMVDFYLAAYPVTIIYSLQISLNRKIGLSFVLGIGFVATIVAIYKCTTLPELYNHADYTYATSGLSIVSSAESNIVILAACLPTLRPFYLFVLGRDISTPGNSAAKSRSDGSKMRSLQRRKHERAGNAPELYPTDTIDLVQEESMERILPENGIRKTQHINMTSHYDHKRVEEGRDRYIETFQ